MILANWVLGTGGPGKNYSTLGLSACVVDDVFSGGKLLSVLTSHIHSGRWRGNLEIRKGVWGRFDDFVFSQSRERPIVLYGVREIYKQRHVSNVFETMWWYYLRSVEHYGSAVRMCPPKMEGRL